MTKYLVADVSIALFSLSLHLQRSGTGAEGWKETISWPLGLNPDGSPKTPDFSYSFSDDRLTKQYEPELWVVAVPAETGDPLVVPAAGWNRTIAEDVSGSFYVETATGNGYSDHTYTQYYAKPNVTFRVIDIKDGENVNKTAFGGLTQAYGNTNTTETFSGEGGYTETYSYTSLGDKYVTHYTDIIQEYYSLFDDNKNVVNFNILQIDQKEAIRNGAYMYDAESGNDVVILPDAINFRNIVPNKSWKSDVFFRAGAGDDTITGGSGNDKIDGGAGEDTLVFAGKYGDYDIDVSRFTDDGASGKIRAVNPKVVKSGTDTFDGVDFLKFADCVVPLHEFEFVIERQNDGKVSKLTFKEDGKVVESLTTGGFMYDDATPIKANSKGYDAVFRLNGGSDPKAAFRVELIDFDTANGQYLGTSTVAGRTAIQIHPGASEQNSEGCFVKNGYFPLLLKYLSNKYDFDKLSGHTFSNVNGKIVEETKLDFWATLPVKVKVLGDIEQPLLNLTTQSARLNEIKSKDIVSDSKKNRYDIKFEYTHDGEDGISKKVNAYFILGSGKDTAKLGEDFVFLKGVSIAGKHGATTVYKAQVMSGANSGSIGIEIQADKENEVAEHLKLSIVDIDLKSNKGKLYTNSSNDSYKLWNPTKTEALLKGSWDFDLIIGADQKSSLMHSYDLLI